MERSRLQREDGFTLVEMMVAVAILAALVLMSLSTFVGVKARGQDSAAKTVATRTLQTGRIVYIDNASYQPVDSTTLSGAETSVRFVDAAVGSTSPTEASTDVPDRATTANIFVAAVYSEAGNCFYIRDWITLGIAYGVAQGVAPAACRANNTGAVAWVSTWP